MFDKRLWIAALVFAGMLVLCACQREPSAVLDDTTCEPPCWNGLQVGSSTRREVASVLSTLPEVSNLVESEVDGATTMITASFVQPRVEELVQVVLVHDVVWAFEFKLRGRVSVGEVIDHTGVPEFSYAHIGCSDRNWLEIGLVNVSQGVHVGLFDDAFRENEQATVAASSPVFSLVYFEPSRFEALVEAHQFYAAMIEPGAFLANLTLWQGYGDVNPIDGCL